MKANTNLKKVFPKNGLEEDCISRWGRKFLCYVQNTPGIKRFAKNQMNRRMRKVSKAEAADHGYYEGTGGHEFVDFPID